MKAILTADWHIMDKQPVCRTDNFIQVQINKMTWISKLQQKYNCAVIHAGDLTENWKSSPFLLYILNKYLPKQFITIYGNHDLPYHNWEMRKKSTIYFLESIGRLTVHNGEHWGKPIKPEPLIIGGRKIYVAHKMVLERKDSVIEGAQAAIFQRSKKRYDLVLTGHNHCYFEKKNKHNRLVNPGSITRHKADQIDHEPCVVLWDSKTNKTKKIKIPIEPAEIVISRKHIELQKQTEISKEKLRTFISSISNNSNKKVSFSETLREVALKKLDEEQQQYLEEKLGEVRNEVK